MKNQPASQSASAAATSAHTPFPWFVELDPETDGPRLGSDGYAIHHDSEVIASGIEKLEDAELICRAVNAHAELVSILRELISYTETVYGHTQLDRGILADAHAALAKAEAQ